MLDVNNRIHIPEQEFRWTFVRSSGPGGQNVNKVASKAVMHWNVDASPSLPKAVKERLRTLQRHRFTREGELLLSSQQHREQVLNVQDCLDKLREMLIQAATVPRKRRPTKPTRGSHERRLKGKRQRSARKVARRRPAED
jgi:ribosome-associated protein